jgi:predicted nicotinamide N-methyase
VQRAGVRRIDWMIFKTVFHDIVRRYKRRRARAGNEVVVGIFHRPNTDMSECVQDALVHKNVIGEHKIGDPINVLLLGRLRHRQNS